MSKKNYLGKAFIDQFTKTTSKAGHFHKHKEGGSSWQDSIIPGGSEFDQTPTLTPWRKLLLTLLLLISFSGIFLRLFHLQVAEGSINRELADSNRIQVKVIHAPRGVIYDRHGKVLAQNNPGFRLIDPNNPQTKPQFVSRDEALKMEVSSDPKFSDLEVDSIRYYPIGQAISHVLGYVSEITAEELKDPDFENYRPGDYIGRGGIEESYEKILRGSDGGEIYEVDAQGKKGRILGTREAIPGQNIYLTVDADLQKITFQKLKEGIEKSGQTALTYKTCCGAAIIQDPKSGAILALASYPSFDPTNIALSLGDPNSAFLNRAISGSYPPGSTFKIASSLAGLYSGKITPQTQFEDTGVMELGPYKFANWYFTEYGRKEGLVNLIKALQRSNDIYYYNLGQIVGEKPIGETAKKLGFNKKLGIDIPGESSGLIPDNDWKIKNFNQVWYPGDTLHMAIGQGFVLATPLQINSLVSFIAADGKQYPPFLANKITDYKGKLVKEYKYDPLNREKFKSEYIESIRKGLEQVPIQGGTAWPFFTFQIATAGKTGTAEFGDPQNKTHAWYTSYAPKDDPKLSMTVLVEAAGEGSTVAAPISKEVYRWYFSPDKNNLIKDLNPISTDSGRTLGE